MEFKREFPQQVSDLAKEIAAFATSNTGTILIGVKDNGDLVGIDEGHDGVVRDALLRRLEGICSGSLKPAVTPRVTWAIELNCVVLAVTVPKGYEPVYYSQGKPYLRHITTSRPAEPHEVVELVKQHLGTRLESGDSEGSEESTFYSNLGSILHRVLLWAETPARERSVNPWLEEWRADYEYAATDLREVAASDVAVRLGIDDRIREVADALTEVSMFRLSMGCWPELEKVASRASELALTLKRDTIDTITLSDESVSQVVDLLRQESRKLSDLNDRAQQIVDAGRVEELQSEVGSLGSKLVQLSFYDLSALGANVSSRLQEVGMGMRLLEASRIYMDGGVSVQQLVEKVKECASQLKELSCDVSD